jgi:Spx/MgsR family transcriptional regulator
MTQKLKIYQYGKCSTCVKALKFLANRKVSFAAVDITETPPTKAELEKMIKAYDGDFKKLFNTSGVQYRELKISEKIAQMTPAEAVKLLSGNGRLVKRPFVLVGDKGLVGFKEDDWKKLF